MDFKQSHIEGSKCHTLLGPLGSDRLVRTSPPASKVNGNLHFTSIDLFNDCLLSLYGKSHEGK